MDEDGSAESGRTRLARGTKPNAPVIEPVRAEGANADAAVQAATAPRGDDDGRVRSALPTPTARSGALPASLAPARHAVRASGAPEPRHTGSVPTGADPTGGAVSASVDARGSGPVAAGGAPGSAGRAPAQSIREAVEQLLEAQEADEALAEWMQGGG